MIRCFAIDDEPYATSMIASYIAKIPFLELVGTCNSATEGLIQVQSQPVDLIFLDIRMPELSGIQFLRLLGNRSKFILTTAYAEYALDGFEHNVIDYLVKPIEFERFVKASHHALERFKNTKLLGTTMVAVEDNRRDYLFVKGDAKNKYIKIDHADILYIEGLKNYVSIYTKTQRIVTYQSLRELEVELPKPPFYRIHKSYIVPLNKVRLIEGFTLFIGDQMLPIGKTYRDELFLSLRPW